MAGIGVEEFNLGIEDWAAKHAGDVPIGQMQRKMVLDVLERVIYYTPRDTGYLTFNWQIGINALPVTPIGIRPKGKDKLPLPAVFMGAVPKFSVVYLSNPVEYAGYVEHGTPRMPASQMLGRAMQDVLRKAYEDVS